MRISQILIVGLGALMFMACNRKGCTDQAAINYDKKAKNDDGSCIYGTGDPNNPNNPNDPNNPNQQLPIQLTGTESTDRTLVDQSSNPGIVDYYVSGTWTINAAITINPGVRIMMKAGSNIVVKSNGSLKINGDPGNTVQIFGEQSAKGYWEYILIESNNMNNQFRYCNISDGSSGTWGSGVITVDDNARVSIQNCSFTNLENDGIYVRNKSSKLDAVSATNFSNISGYPINVKSLAQTANISTSNTFTQNTKNKVYVNGDSYSGNITIPVLDIPYLLNGSNRIESDLTTVNAGTVFEMRSDATLRVESNGSLKMVGTASSPITVRGEAPTKGYWNYIFIESNNNNNVLSYVNISDAAGGTWGSGAVTVYEATLNMDNTNIQNCSGTAVHATSGSTFNNNGNNSYSGCDGGGGELP